MIRECWQLLGRLMYWVTWPGQYFLLKNSRRTRVVIVYKNQVLVVKGWLGDGKWSLPGGGVKRGETDEVATRREVLEETGYDIQEPLLALGEYFGSKHKISFIVVKYGIELTTKPKLKRQKFEIVDLAWLPLDKLSSSNASPNTLDALTAWNDHLISVTIK